MSMCGSEGTGLPSCRTSTPSSYRAPASSSAEMNWLDADASMVTAPPRAGAGAEDGERQRPAVLVLDVDAEAAQPLQHLVHRAEPGVRVAVEDHRAVGQRRDRRHEPHHRAGEPAVDGGAAPAAAPG